MQDHWRDTRRRARVIPKAISSLSLTAAGLRYVIFMRAMPMRKEDDYRLSKWLLCTAGMMMMRDICSLYHAEGKPWATRHGAQRECVRAGRWAACPTRLHAQVPSRPPPFFLSLNLSSMPEVLVMAMGCILLIGRSHADGWSEIYKRGKGLIDTYVAAFSEPCCTCCYVSKWHLRSKRQWKVQKYISLFVYE